MCVKRDKQRGGWAKCGPDFLFFLSSDDTAGQVMAANTTNLFMEIVQSFDAGEFSTNFVSLIMC